MGRIKAITKPKHIIRALKKIVSNFPPVEYAYLEKLSLPLWQDEEGKLYPKKEDEGEEKRRMVTAVIKKGFLNHKRGVKKAFQKGGEAGATAYLYVYQPKIENNEIQKEASSN